MYKVLIGLLFSFLVACSDKGSDSSKQVRKDVKQADLSEELYSKLLAYQMQFPLPRSGTNGFQVYVAEFLKHENDTLLLLARPLHGAAKWKDDMLWGVYEDKLLQPTIIKDSKLNYSRNFVLNRLNDSVALQKYNPMVSDLAFPDSSPPFYVYKVVGNSLEFKSRDTVYGNW